MGEDTLSKQQRSNTMSAVLARPRHSAPLRLHLNHFLKFVTQIGSRVNGHKALLSETLRYLLSLAKNQGSPKVPKMEFFYKSSYLRFEFIKVCKIGFFIKRGNFL